MQLHHIALRSRDFDRSVAFYTDVIGLKPLLGFKLKDGAQRVLILAMGDEARLEIFEEPDLPEAEGDPILTHLCFRSDDCRADLDRVRALGYEVTAEANTIELENWAAENAAWAGSCAPASVPVTFGFFKGPDGETLEFFENAHT